MMKILFLLFFMTTNSYAGIEALLTLGHHSKETFTLEQQKIKNRTIYVFTLKSEKSGNLIKVIPKEHYKKTLSEIKKWQSLFFQKTHQMGNACGDNITIQLNDQIDTFCLSFIETKDRSDFNSWYTKAFRGY